MELRKHGGFYHSARVAGVHPSTAWRHHDSDPEFARLVGEAREEHADQLERELEQMAREKGNPVGHIVRLKAIRPQAYIERHAVMSMNVSSTVAPADLLPLLHAMLADASPATRAMLAPADEGETPSDA